MRTFILTKAYAMQLGNSKEDDEKAKYLLDLVQEFDKRQEEEEAKEKPINISFDELSGESGTTINPESYYLATINVSFRIDKNSAEKYIEKRLTIKDLNDMIKYRK